MRLPLAALAAVLLLSGCTSVHPAPDSPAPQHRPAGQAVPVPSASPPAPASPPAQPRGRAELAWIGPSPDATAAEDRRGDRRPGGQADRPRRSVSTPWRARPPYPRKSTTSPRSPRRWAPSTPRVPTGGGMRSVCRSAQGIVSPGLAGMCRSISR
ncbi:hypothetical protein ACFC36_19680 [Streptomyces rubiginosohelvolus]|uniref:hypothetical protein n=1 Tax=Streptomyces rubiginosohelvolus TaxID=67362 RepID=UPI0035D5660E